MIQYHDMLRHILKNGSGHDDRTGVGTKSVFGYQNRYNLRDGFPLVTTKRLSFRWIAEELFWFLSGSTNVEDLRNRCKKPITIWDDWADEKTCAKFGREAGDLGPIYGYTWNNFGGQYPERNGINQIEKLINDIQKNPNSRRLIVSGWDPATCEDVSLPPCHTLFQFKVDNGTLHCQLYQRSADSFLGVPYNIASYSLLTHMIAHVCGLQVGDFIHTFGDLHIYNNHIDQVNEQLSRDIRPLPTLTINERTYGKGYQGLMDINWSDILLSGYDPHPSIKAEVAV